MRIAYLCKRRYMSKDVILDRYARLYEIPFQLARLGHDVRGWCLGYRNEHELFIEHEASPGRLQWHARGLGARSPLRLLSYPFELLRSMADFNPDLLIGASDIPHVALAGWLARRKGMPYVVDLYDNFEGFSQARLPGMVKALRWATRGAGIVLTTSEPLRKLVLDEYRARGNVISMPSTIDMAVFRRMDKARARQAFGLPAEARLIGTAGGLSREKGVDLLYEAWPGIASACGDVHLVLAGPREQGLPMPEGARVHYLGLLSHGQVAELFNALDLGIITVPDTLFGQFSFPQKAYEMLACGLPVTASRVGAMSELFAGVPQALFEPDDAGSLSNSVIAQLRAPASPDVPLMDWAGVIARIEPLLQGLLSPP